MADLLDSGLAWLAQKVRAHASAALAYQRGESSVTIAGTWTRVDRAVADALGLDLRLDNEMRDLIVSADQLTTLGDPQVHDKIVEVLGEQTRTYEVLPIAGTQTWQWLGNRERVYRIHVKRIS
jgi:hypothetical protein